MSTIQAIGTFIGDIVTATDSIQVPGFSFTFLDMIIGSFAISIIAMSMRLLLNFGGGKK